MNAKLIGIVASVAAMGGLVGSVVALQAPVAVSVVVQPEQVTPLFAGGGLAQSPPKYFLLDGVTPIGAIHVTVGGTLLGGSYTAYEEPPASELVTLPTGVEHKRRGWSVYLLSPSGSQGYVIVQRHIDSMGNVTWDATAGVGPAGGGGASTGNLFSLGGTDFNCSGNHAFIGDPAWGGGGNITVTVAP